MKKLDLTGKISLITGGTKGIGKGIAKAFCQNGSKVVIIGRNRKRGEEASNQLKALYNRECIYFKCDVSKYNEVKKTCKKVLDKFKKLDILVCNAGYDKVIPLTDLTLEEWSKTIAINLNGALYFIHYLIDYMLKQKKGNIIIIGSSTTINGGGGGIHYSASKAGLIGIVKSITYNYLPKGIRINLITPSIIDTPLFRKRYPNTKEVNKMLADQIPLGRIGTPEDVANIALFLASDLSEYICGQEIIADGGRILYRHPPRS